MRLVRLWRTRRPVTFNEKVRYALLRDHRPLVVAFADKARMRERVTALVGEGHLPHAHALVEDPSQLGALPEEHVLKPTHGSGACLVVSRDADPAARLPTPEHGWVYATVRPEHADRAQVAAIARGWLGRTYGRGPNHEWAYGHAVPRLLVEELLRGTDGGVPDDVKLFVFHGHGRFAQVDSGRFGTRTRDFFDREGRPLELEGGLPRRGCPAPARLPEMLDLAERLAQDTDFLRVDLYVADDRLVVGELTASPAGGDSPFHPASWDAEFGRTWRVRRRYR